MLSIIQLVFILRSSSSFILQRKLIINSWLLCSILSLMYEKEWILEGSKSF